MLKSIKKILLTITLTFVCFSLSNAQQIEIEKSFWGYKIIQDGNRITESQLLEVLKPNKDAYILIRKAKTNNLISIILSGVGGGLTGYPIGTSLGGGDPNWTLAAIGGGLLVVAIPISLAANKNLKKAVEVYNADFNKTSFYFKPSFKIIANNKGVGVGMNF